MTTKTPVTIELNLTDVPARDLPMGLVSDVTKVLEAHGLVIEGTEYSELLVGLARVVDAVPVERGGRK